MVLSVVAYLFRTGFKKWLMARISDFTGDCLGAAQQLMELLIYVAFAAAFYNAACRHPNWGQHMTTNNQAYQSHRHLVQLVRVLVNQFCRATSIMCAEACSNGRLNYIAAATYLDDEMRERIAHHKDH